MAAEAYRATVEATGVGGGLGWGRGVLFLQTDMDGEQARTAVAVIHAILRCRAVLRKGLSFGSQSQVVDHVVQLVQHPWIACASNTVTRTERSRLRGRQPPPDFLGAIVYRSDGAARGQGRGGSTGAASFGAVRLRDGTVEGRCGRTIGDATNNVEEYMGILSSFRDACNRFLGSAGNGVHVAQCVFQVDSMLVNKQGNFLWRCLSAELAPYYEQVIDCVRALEGGGIQVTILHIYREFNTLADGLANEVLDSGQNICENWLLGRRS